MKNEDELEFIESGTNEDDFSSMNTSNQGYSGELFTVLWLLLHGQKFNFILLSFCIVSLFIWYCFYIVGTGENDSMIGRTLLKQSKNPTALLFHLLFKVLGK